MKKYLRQIIPLLLTIVGALLLSACAPTSSGTGQTTPNEPIIDANNDAPDEAVQSPTSAESLQSSTDEQSDETDTAATDAAQPITSEEVEVTSGGQAYLSYLAAPAEGGSYPAVVLIHSFNGMEDGYRTMTDRFAAEGFVVLAVGWQTFERQPSDDVMEQLLLDSIAFLTNRPDVDANRLGLTGFCAGGRYTMLFLPQIPSFKAGVAWYGFPYGGETQPASLIGDLSAPMLMIHGAEDEPSPITQIYDYANALKDAGKTFELKVYSGEPHGFMLSGGQLREDEIAIDAFREMVEFFRRKLG